MTDIMRREKAERYRDLAQAIGAITEGEPDAIANMANAAALLWEHLPDTNWVGFYRVIAGELVLGPFQGKIACIRIAMGAGVCGTAAASGKSQLVDDVHAFPGHIACDATSASELVIPIIVDGNVMGVLDIDSPTLAHFDQQDLEGLEAIIKSFAPRLVNPLR